MLMELPTIVRTVSGKGIIKIPDEYTSALDIMLYVQVLRKVQTPYLNLSYNPPKGFYAHISFCKDDFVLEERDVCYDSQAFEIYNGQQAQNLLSLICAYDGILDSFVSLGDLLGVVLSRTNKIKKHPYLEFKPNILRFNCFGTSALLLTLTGTSLDICDVNDGTSTAPPVPPVPLPRVPFDQPVQTSPPYDGSTDGGSTVPADIDEPQSLPFPFGTSCTSYLVTATFTSEDFPSGNTLSLVISGRILGVVVESDGNPSTSDNYAVQGERIDPATGECTQTYLTTFVLSASPGTLEIIAIAGIPD